MPPLAALILDWLITALWPIVAKSGTRLYSGILFTSAGLVIGLALLSPWLCVKNRMRRIFSRQLAPSLFLMGVFSGIASVIYISATAYTTPANAAIMAQIEVIYSALLCAFFLKERITLGQGLASLLVMGGTGLIMAHDLSSPRWKGDLMILATPWMFQVSHIFSKRLPKDIDPVTATAGRVIYGLAAMAPFCAWTIARGGAWTWEPEGLRLLAVQGLFMSCLNFILWYAAILNMELAKATAVLLSYPALTLVFSWALGRETIAPVQIVGLVVTMSGAYWMTLLLVRAQRALPERQRVPSETGSEI
ncbi:MAG: DMT family transporter [Elusimicrobia bacterium]|nr:DMT family transporter [Elusimicrobiota bacterium]